MGNSVKRLSPLKLPLRMPIDNDVGRVTTVGVFALRALWNETAILSGLLIRRLFCWQILRWRKRMGRQRRLETLVQ
jgi:hypothetical protein